MRKLDALLGGDGGDLADDRRSLLRPAELAGIALDRRDRVGGRRRRIQLVRPVRDAHVDLVAHLVDGALEAPLADAAPRADHIRPDVDVDHGACCRHGPTIRPVPARSVSWRP
ncbi:MAG: hypothetical protein QM733_16745 [Ilumatobacteraceae bacterium]